MCVLVFVMTQKAIGGDYKKKKEKHEGVVVIVVLV